MSEVSEPLSNFILVVTSTWDAPLPPCRSERQPAPEERRVQAPAWEGHCAVRAAHLAAT